MVPMMTARKFQTVKNYHDLVDFHDLNQKVYHIGGGSWDHGHDYTHTHKKSFFTKPLKTTMI